MNSFAGDLELGLGDLEDGVELGGEHNVALDLELAGHEGLLGVDLAVGEAEEGVVREVDGDVCAGQREQWETRLGLVADNSQVLYTHQAWYQHPW